MVDDDLNEYYNWVRLKLFAEGDEADVLLSDLISPNARIRKIAKELRTLSAQNRFSKLGHLYRTHEDPSEADEWLITTRTIPRVR